MTEHESNIFKEDERKFNPFCIKFKQVLGDKVEEVFVDNMHDRKPDCPLRIIDHAINEKLERVPTKLSIGINPANTIMTTLRLRWEQDSEDRTIKDIILLLYDVSLVEKDFVLPDPKKHHTHVCKLIKLGLAIFSSDDDEDDDDVNEGELSSASLTPIMDPDVD